jgi:hypothetical protein
MTRTLYGFRDNEVGESERARFVTQGVRFLICLTSPQTSNDIYIYTLYKREVFDVFVFSLMTRRLVQNDCSGVFRCGLFCREMCGEQDFLLTLELCQN